ncbi:MAG TPA: CDP-alcohol phosphatidyltransferase family protein [Longimicrobiales bacterium]|nr:CDP-alcohol phosphatidyltransferase family protein [Longimicrobiales bacterium]
MRPDVVVLLALVALALASMPLYAATAAHRRDALEIADRGSFVLGSFVRSWFYWFVRPFERAALALRISPTAFNLLGVAFGVAAGALFATGRLNLGGWAVLLGGVADVLDGRVARGQGLDGPRGAFLDSTLDRFAEVGAFVGLSVLFRGSAPAVALVAAGLGGSLLVSYARARGESVGLACKVGVMQRAERLLLIGFGGILDPSVCAAAGWAEGTLLLGILALVAAGTVGTAVYRTVWIARRLGRSV